MRLQEISGDVSIHHTSLCYSPRNTSEAETWSELPLKVGRPIPCFAPPCFYDCSLIQFLQQAFRFLLFRKFLEVRKTLAEVKIDIIWL